MAKIPRATLTLFGSSGPTNDFEQFGSTAAGATNYTKTIATIQSLAAWATGIRAALLTGKAPTLQDVNAVFYVAFTQLCYMFENGMAEWDAGTNYFTGSIVKRVSAPEFYSSKIDNNLNNALPTAGTSDSNWQYMSGIISGSFQPGAPVNMNSQKVTNLTLGSATGDGIAWDQVQRMWKYRRPNLFYGSATVVIVETGLDGTASDCTIIFPDGNVRTDSDITRNRMTITQNAVFNNATRASNVGGLRTGSAAANTWYALYAVKVTAGSGAATDFVIVADTVQPIQTNYTTLNSNFGTNGWVYLGTIAYGDNSGATTSIVKFSQNGNITTLGNLLVGNASTLMGIRFATTAAAATLSYTAANGSSTAAQIPSNFGGTLYMSLSAVSSSGNQQMKYLDASTGLFFASPSGITANVPLTYSLWWNTSLGIVLTNVGASSIKYDIALSGWIDNALGSSEPLL